MLTKYFDCQVDAGYPVARIPVEVPETASEALALLDPAHLEATEREAAAQNATAAVKLAAMHEKLRVETLAKLYKQDGKTWLRENESRLADDPTSAPATFQDAFALVYESSAFADRFARADAKAEYFRLYGISDTCAAFNAIEVQVDHPAPADEHKNWTKIRRQISTHATERSVAARQALLQQIQPKAEEPEADE